MMKTLIQALLLPSILITASTLQAQNFHMVKDINEATDANPDNINFFSSGGGLNYAYAVLNNVAYFAANDGIHGNELWRSDGTPQGTYILKDIIAGLSGSSPTAITTSGSYVYFITYSGDSSRLWRTNGTKAGTIFLASLSYRSLGFFSVNLTDVNGTLYFTADGVNGLKLMKSDGTVNGTVTVVDFGSASDYSNVFNLCSVNNKLFFFSSSSSFNGLFITDGTSAGTIQLTNSYASYNYTNYTAGGNKFYFRGEDFEPWVSDGTVAGTHVIKAINPNNSGSQPDNFESINGVVCFTATDETHGTELWVTNGNMAGTYLLKDIAAGSDSSVLSSFTVVNNNIFFLRKNAAGNTDLWKTDGTTNGTIAVKTFTNGYLSPAQYLANVNGTLYFQNFFKSSGYEIWKSDGTESGTVLVKDIYQGIYSSSAKNFTALNNHILFSSTNGTTGTELWLTDGNVSGTLLLKDINQTTNSGSYPNWSVTPFKNKIYFNAFTPQDGNELWTTDGTAANTTRLTDIEAGSTNGIRTIITKFFTSTNRLYFQADNGKYGSELWSTDGINYNLVKDITPGRGSTRFPSDYYPGNKKEYANIDSVVYFVSDVFYGNALWKTTGKGAVLLKNGAPINGLTTNLTNVYFSYNNNELWKTNGTVAGTVRLSNAMLPNSSYYIPSIISFKNMIYFQSADNNMWVTDGTNAGTVVFKNIKPQFDDVFQFANTTSVELNDILYFAADDGTSGLELWKTDGTTAGTVLVKDINKGSGGSLAGNNSNGYFTRVGNIFYFVANDGAHGSELWKSDGTQAGTVLVKDITKGSNSSMITSLLKVGNKAAFLLYDSIKRNEILWQSDGTKTGTVAVTDTNLKNVSINDYFGSTLSALGNQLYFAGATTESGQELWTGTLKNVNINRSSDTGLIIKNNFESGIMISASPNPAKNNLIIKVSYEGIPQQAQLKIADVKGNFVYKSQVQLNKGTSTYQCNISTLAQGFYVAELALPDGKIYETRFLKQ